LVESGVTKAIASRGIEGEYIHSFDCSDGTKPVVKPVAAVSGDRVEVSGNADSVNGLELAKIASLSQDRRGRRVPRVAFGQYQGEADEVWGIGPNDRHRRDSCFFKPTPPKTLFV